MTVDPAGRYAAEAALTAWRESATHRDNCDAWYEGVYCCLDERRQYFAGTRGHLHEVLDVILAAYEEGRSSQEEGHAQPSAQPPRPYQPASERVTGPPNDGA